MNNKDWIEDTLLSISNYMGDGDWIESKNQSEDGIRLIQTGNVGNGYYLDKNDRAKYISEETFNKLKCTEVLPNDILISRLPDPVGRCCIVPDDVGKAITAVDCTIVRNNPDRCYLRYLYYFLQSKQYFNQIEITGTTRDRVTRKKLEKIIVPIPPISEQKHIVSIIDKAFKKLDEFKDIIEKQLINVEELFQSYLDSMLLNESLRWNEVTLDTHVQFIDYRGRTPEKTKSGIRLITAKNVRMGFLKKDPEEFIAIEEYDVWMRRGIPEFGDVIFTTEAPLANVAQIDTHEKLAFAQRIIVMHPDTSYILQDFLKYLLLSQPIRIKIFEKESGATVTGIKAKLLKKIEIPVPEIPVQKQIVGQLDNIMVYKKELLDFYSQKLAYIEELRNSILDKAFHGELIR